jgi:hypothetical protein
MKRNSFSQSAFFYPRMLVAVAFCATGVFLALIGLGAFSNVSASAPNRRQELKPGTIVISSYHNDVSAPLRDMALLPAAQPRENEKERRREDNLNPKLPFHHVDKPDPVIQQKAWIASLVPQMPGTILNFAGIPYPGVGCSCSPPDTNGEVGATQYVQMVNEGYQVFNKSNGASVLGPASIVSLWSGFGGACQTGGFGDPVVLYDQLANRWIITQFASATGGTPITDQCIAVSTTSDATGTYNRYGYHLGSNFFDYPHLGVWPDGYYMSMNVFNSAGTAFLGPQAFAFDRAAMLAGTPATIVTPGITGGPSEDSFLPGDLDGSTLPPAGAPNTFVEFPGTGTYRVFHFHADFVTPANTTFTLFASPAAAGFTELCAATRSCVPQGGTSVRLDGIGDRLMFRLPYRNFGDHESMVGNYTVSAGGVSGVRWFELRNVTAGPVTVFQQSTFQPADGLWRWMGSAAMDGDGNLAIGYSASSAGAFPGIRYAGRLVGEPLNTLGQGEAILISGGGSQTSTGDRWGDYSDMTIDPVDDHTFWYTNEYYIATASVNWQTRIANFKFITAPNLLSAGGSSIVAAGPNGVPDPGEYVTVSLGVQNIGTGGCTTAALNGTLQVSGGVTNPSPASQNYGVVCTGGGAVFRTFTFKVDPALACGAPITASLALLDGAIDYGTLTYTLSTGTPAVSFSENFDGVVAPALPAGWTTAHTGSELGWVTSTTNPSSAPNAAFAPDPTTVGNTELVTPSIPIPAGGAQLTFRNLYNMESSGGNFYDGMVLEISINGGAFTDIITAGGSFVAGGYVGTISSGFSSPLAGRQAWSGLSGGSTTTPAYITTTVNLPAAAGGQSIRLKWRAATDSSVAAAGQAGVRVDTISMNTLVCAPAAQTAKSRKTHTGIPTPFSVDLPLAGNIGVECRDGGITHDFEMVVNFATTVSVTGSPQAQVISGTGTVGTGGIANGGAVTVTGSEVSVPLTNVANAQVLTVRLNNVNAGAASGAVTVSVGMLVGDVNGDTSATHSVNSSDVSQVQFESGHPVGDGNFRADVTASGDINSSDVSEVQAQSGTGF